MKTLLTTAAALVIGIGVASAETVGDPALFGQVEAGTSRVTVEIGGAAGFTRAHGSARRGIVQDPASGLDRHFP